MNAGDYDRIHERFRVDDSAAGRKAAFAAVVLAAFRANLRASRGELALLKRNAEQLVDLLEEMLKLLESGTADDIEPDVELAQKVHTEFPRLMKEIADLNQPLLRAYKRLVDDLDDWLGYRTLIEMSRN